MPILVLNVDPQQMPLLAAAGTKVSCLLLTNSISLVQENKC